MKFVFVAEFNKQLKNITLHWLACLRDRSAVAVLQYLLISATFLHISGDFLLLNCLLYLFTCYR